MNQIIRLEGFMNPDNFVLWNDFCEVRIWRINTWWFIEFLILVRICINGVGGYSNITWHLGVRRNFKLPLNVFLLIFARFSLNLIHPWKLYGIIYLTFDICFAAIFSNSNEAKNPTFKTINTSKPKKFAQVKRTAEKASQSPAETNIRQEAFKNIQY